jgi:hypothetical protein
VGSPGRVWHSSAPWCLRIAVSRVGLRPLRANCMAAGCRREDESNHHRPKSPRLSREPLGQARALSPRRRPPLHCMRPTQQAAGISDQPSLKSVYGAQRPVLLRRESVRPLPGKVDGVGSRDSSGCRGERPTDIAAGVPSNSACLWLARFPAVLARWTTDPPSRPTPQSPPPDLAPDRRVMRDERVRFRRSRCSTGSASRTPTS